MGITAAELAKRLGVSPQAVGHARKRGRITREDDGTYDPDKAIAEWNEKGQQQVQGHRQSDAYQKARTLREQYQAELARLELEEKQMKLLRAADVIRTWSSVLRLVKERILAFPERLGHLLAAESGVEPNRCIEIIRGECHALLTEIVGMARNGKEPH